MASFYPKTTPVTTSDEGRSDAPPRSVSQRVAASLRSGAARQENLARRAANPPTPGQLLHRALIAKENSSEDVLRIAEEKLQEFDANTCATAIHKVAQLCRKRNANSVSRDGRFVCLLRMALPCSTSWSPRQLCHVAWSMATLSIGGGGNGRNELLDQICLVYGQKLSEGVPQDLSTFAWALAALLVENPVFPVLMRTSMDRLSEFGSQDLAISAWSLTKILYAERRPMLSAIAQESIMKLKEFGGRNLSSISWAYATAQHRDLPLFDALVEECTSRVSELGSQELPITLWALAVSGYPADSVFEAASNQATLCVGGMDVSHICNILWASARAAPRDEKLFNDLAEVAIHRTCELEPLHVANLCWAFANVARADEVDRRKSGLRHVRLFRVLSQAASRLAWQLLPQHHASILWSFAACEVRDGVAELTDALLPAMRARPVKDYDPRQAAGMLWSLAVLSQQHQPMIDFLLYAVCHSGTEGLVRDGPAHLASIVWAAARLVSGSSMEKALSNVHLLALELAGTASAELSEGRRQNIAAVVRSMYDLGLSDAAHQLLQEFEALGLLSPGAEAWSAWLCGAAGIHDLQLEVQAWTGLADSCDGAPRSSFAFNAAAVQALRRNCPDLARWALQQAEGESDAISNLLRSKVGLPHVECNEWIRGEYGHELSLARQLCLQPMLTLDDELLQMGSGLRAHALDAAINATTWRERSIILELGCGIGAGTLRAAQARNANASAPSGARVIACESDPVRAAAALCLSFAAEGVLPGVQMDVRVGRSEQLLPQLRAELGAKSVDMLILGSLQGTEYHEDFARALDLLAPGATVVADGVLDPMCPEFMWHLPSLFQETFAVDVEDDWVVIGTGFAQRPSGTHGRLSVVPEEVSQLRFQADEARRRTAAWRFRDRLVAGPTRDGGELEAARCAYQDLGLVPGELVRSRTSRNGAVVVELPQKEELPTAWP